MGIVVAGIARNVGRDLDDELNVSEKACLLGPDISIIATSPTIPAAGTHQESPGNIS
jgi:hypothetical protein